LRTFLFSFFSVVAVFIFAALTGTRGKLEHADPIPWSKVQGMIPFFTLFGIGWGLYMAIRPWLLSKLRRKKDGAPDRQ
jgi:hypothetical protein